MTGDAMSRRDALRRVGLALGGVGLGVAGLGASGAGASEVSDLRSGDGGLEPLGVQLYTVRDEMARDVPATLAALAAMGYAEVEFAGTFGHTPVEVRRMLEAVGLRAPAAHVAPDFDDGAWARILGEAAEIGHTAVIIPWIGADMRSSADDWRRTADAMTRAGERARAAGLAFGYHNHDFEFTRFDDRTGLDLLLDGTDPDVVFLELDLFWAAHAGVDPVEFLAAHPGRVQMVHVKDRAADGTMVDVGAGALDWPRLIGACRGAGVAHYFVEHDNPADGSLRSVRTSLEYLRAI